MPRFGRCAPHPRRIVIHLTAILTLVAMAWGGLAIAGADRADDARRPGGSGPVRFGMVTALSGPAADLGRAMRAGVLAAFARHNAGPAGAALPVELECRDDGYEPARTGALVRELIRDRGVVGVVGNVGTPTGVIAMPICVEAERLYLAPFSGARALRPTPPSPFVFHLRASYDEEIEAMVAGLVGPAGLRPEEIAFFTQRDAYGDAGYAAGLDALRRHGLPTSARPLHVRYERNTLDVEAALADCLSSERRPRAIVLVGTYRPCARFIRLARESDFAPLFLNVSFVGAEALAAELGPLGDGVIVTEVVPTLDALGPLADEWRSALGNLPLDVRVEPSLGALEGYLAGRMVLEAVGRAADPRDARSLSTALESLGDLDLGIGRPMSLGPTKHQASDAVWPSVIRWTDAPRITAFDWSSLAPAPASAHAPEETER